VEGYCFRCQGENDARIHQAENLKQAKKTLAVPTCLKFERASVASVNATESPPAMPRVRVHPGYDLNLPAPSYSGEHEFAGLHGFVSKCGIDVWHLHGQTLVMLTELPDNPGTSVTNYFERLATHLLPFVALFTLGEGSSPESIIWVEHYERAEGSGLADTWDRVRLSWDGTRYHSPEWEPWERLCANGKQRR